MNAPDVCADCGRRHSPGLLHAAGCMACTREMVKGRKRRDSVICSHRCESRDCRERQRMDKRGYVLSLWCETHERQFEARLQEIADSPPRPGPILLRQDDEFQRQSARRV